MKRISLLLVTLAVLLLGGCSIQINPPDYPVEGYVAKAEAMTVKVLTSEGSGSGVFISEDVVLTAKHVLTLYGPVENITIQVGTDTYRAEILEMPAWDSNQDMSHDWALLQVKGYKSPYWATVGCDRTQIGETVFSIGYPLGKNQMNFIGTVIDPDYSTAAWAGVEDIWQHGILTTLMIAPGASGGPVFDTDGRLLGIMVGQLVAGSQFGQTVYPVAYTGLCDNYDEHYDDRIRLDDPDMENPTVIR